MHQIFGIRFSPGLADFVRSENGDRESIVYHLTPNLHVLTTGTSNGVVRDLFNKTSDWFTEVTRWMRTTYRFILVDMPATSDMSSTLRIASKCDGVILVVAADHLRWEVVQKEKRQLEKWQTNILGVVLNRRRFPIPECLYRAL